MKVVAIVGTYRPRGITNQVVDRLLEQLELSEVETQRINLIDEDIAFCDNCRSCCQVEGNEPGDCRRQDKMNLILKSVHDADAIILACPMNAGLVTAVFKRFMERLLPLYYWPWGNWAPKQRDKRITKKAILVTSSAMPAWMSRLLTPVSRSLRETAKALGAKPILTISIGKIALNRQLQLPSKVLARIDRAAAKLVQARR
jgi:multimeric flavodoxin WrbA